MKLYHGSSICVPEPKILQSNRTLDFGYGFYTTSNYEQAVANDRVYASINAYENGFMDKAKLLEELKTWVYVDQISYHSESALSYLTFIEAVTQ